MSPVARSEISDWVWRCRWPARLILDDGGLVIWQYLSGVGTPWSGSVTSTQASAVVAVCAEDPRAHVTLCVSFLDEGVGKAAFVSTCSISLVPGLGESR